MLKRIIVGIIGIPLFIALIMLGGYYFFALVLLLSNLAIWEYNKIAEAKAAHPINPLSYIMNTLFLSGFFVSLYIGGDYTGFPALSVLIPIILLNILLHTVFNLWNINPNNTFSIAGGIAGFNYITLFFSSLIAISLFRDFAEVFLMLPQLTLLHLGEMPWSYILMAMFISIWSSDSLAYFSGRAFGKHKLFERVSPKKTWEGAVGGFFGAIAGFALPIYFTIPEFSIYLAVAIGAIIGIVAPLGDLAESQMKRDAGIKDSSNIIPGHGGILDRFDSTLFTAPVLLICLIIYYTFVY